MTGVQTKARLKACAHVLMSSAAVEVKAPAKAAKARERGLSVLERRLAEEKAEAEKQAARRAAQPPRSKSVPRAHKEPDKDKSGGEGERGRSRQRMKYESGQRKKETANEGQTIRINK